MAGAVAEHGSVGESTWQRAVAWYEGSEGQRLRRVVATVLLWRIVFLVVGWFARWLTTTDSVRPHFGLDHWLQWDAHHHLAVAEFGYDDRVADGNSAGLFPGHPAFVRLVVEMSGLSYLVAGMVVTFLSTVVAAYYLHRLAELDGHDPARSVLALVLFPTAVFLVAPYTEALFLAAAIPAFYYARQGRAWATLPFLMLATFTRAVGPFVALGVLVELARRNGVRSPRSAVQLLAVVVAGALPAVVHGIALSEREGTVFAYAKAQGRFAGRGFANPIDGFLTTARTWWSGASANNLVTFQLELLAVVAVVALIIRLVRRRELGYAAFVAATLLVSVCSPYWLSIPRFALTMFPFAFALADLAERPGWRDNLLPVLAGCSTLGVVVFVRGHWYF